MTVWHSVLIFGLASGAVAILYNIFLEVRSIRRMMNFDRRMSNEVHQFEDDD